MPIRNAVYVTEERMGRKQGIRIPHPSTLTDKHVDFIPWQPHVHCWPFQTRYLPKHPVADVTTAIRRPAATQLMSVQKELNHHNTAIQFSRTWHGKKK
ncbi:hypothetical protein PR048_008991 [Dryococelus australis]|uniref:Uncharacterized protein n=1 Tax=Dryococelus australis TaxID=614101 RepID=A0ABQ9HZ14_9NEOP|nr:hypothetical protein PR048_008991 [Dryococelus australis]